jgi:putrescine transport system ATP-binding protein
LAPGQPIVLALRPEKVTISRERPPVENVVAGTVQDLGYFGKDSLYRVELPGGQVMSVNSVNARRAREIDRVAVWEDKVWLSFEPDSAILLKD